MRMFHAMLRTALRQQLQYRSAALAGVVTQVAFGLIYIMVYQAFYRSNPDSLPEMTLVQTVSYVWLSQGAYRMLAWSGVREIEAMMRDGRIAFELARPQDLYWMWNARAIALRTAPLLINAPIIVALSLLMPPDMRLIVPLACLPAGLLSLLLGMLISSALTTILTASTFFTISGQGINRFLPSIGALCAGSVLPLSFFPEGVRTALRLLPFSGMLDAPLRILLGAAGGGEAAFLMGLQVFWLLALTVLGRCLMRAGVKKCMVQGG